MRDAMKGPLSGRKTFGILLVCFLLTPGSPLFAGGPPRVEIRLDQEFRWVLKDQTPVHGDPTSGAEVITRLQKDDLVWTSPDSFSEKVIFEGTSGRWRKCYYFGETLGSGYIFDAHTTHELDGTSSQDPDRLLKLTGSLTRLFHRFDFPEKPPLRFLREWDGVEIQSHFHHHGFHTDSSDEWRSVLQVQWRPSGRASDPPSLEVRYESSSAYERYGGVDPVRPFTSTGRMKSDGADGSPNPYGPFWVYPWITSVNLRLREDPSLSGKILLTLPKGTTVAVLERGREEVIDGISGHWVKINYPRSDETGWCFDGYLTPR